MSTSVIPPVPRPFRPRTAATLALTALLLVPSVPAVATEADMDCWTDEPGAIGAIDHPTGATDIVLRLFVGGGFVPQEISFLERPAFTLYGNNVAIYRGDTQMAELDDPLPPFACARLSPGQVDELLAAALDGAGLRDAADVYPHPYIVDTPSTVFTVDADGVDKTVVVESLGFDQAPDPEARASFQDLADLLTQVGPAGEAPVLYPVPAYEALVSEPWGEFDTAAVPWPWDDVEPESSEDGGAVLALTPAQAGQVVQVPSGGQAFIRVELPDRRLVNLTIRPLLPDEVTSSDVG